MRLLFLVLFVLLGLIQYPLWMGKGGWFKVWDLQRQVAAQRDQRRPARAQCGAGSRSARPGWGHRRCRGTCARRAGHDAGRRGLRAYPAAERHAAGGGASLATEAVAKPAATPARAGLGAPARPAAGAAASRRAGPPPANPVRARVTDRSRTIAAPGLTSRTGRGVIRSAACGRLPTPCPRAMVASATIGRMRVHLHVQFHHDRQQAARQRLAGVPTRVVGRQARSESRALACWRRLRATRQRDQQRPQRRGQRLVQIGQPQGQRIGLEDVRCLARRARACCRSW